MKNVFKAVVCAIILGAPMMSPARANDIGFTRLHVADPMGGDMQVSLWYPTHETGGTIKLGSFTFDAARDAEPVAGPLGLVVLSHGTEGSDLGHRNVAIELARAGHVVAAPLHPRDNFRDNSGVGKRIVMEGRPRQISAVIDALLTDQTLGNRIDANRIGAFGFSLGGYTILAVLGAQPDMLKIADHCETSTPDPFCTMLGGRDGGLREHIEQEYQTPLPDLADPRICAASIADPLAVPFSDASLAGISARYVQIWRPEHENVLLAEAHAGRVVEQLNTRSDAEVTPEIIVKGAQHYSFLAPFPSHLKSVLPSELTRDADGFDRSAFQKKFAKEVAAFLSSSLVKCSVGR